MSMVSDQPKMKRYKVTFKGYHSFANATGHESALAQVRNKILKDQVERSKSDPTFKFDIDLANPETFAKVAGVRECTRY